MDNSASSVGRHCATNCELQTLLPVLWLLPVTLLLLKRIRLHCCWCYLPHCQSISSYCKLLQYTCHAHGCYVAPARLTGP